MGDSIINDHIMFYGLWDQMKYTVTHLIISFNNIYNNSKNI